MFSPEAIKRADRHIAEYRSRYDIDLYIETITELPEADAALLRSMKYREQTRKLRQVAEDRAEAAGVNGIYILVTTQPSNTVIVGWPAAREREDLPLEKGGGLSSWKRENELRKPFAKMLTANHNDNSEALDALVSHFLKAVRSRETPPPSPLETGPAAVFVVAMLAGWLALTVLRGAVARNQAAVTNEPVGTLYQPAILGSMFGVPAGFWIYDRLYRCEQPTALAAAREATLPPGSPSTPVIPGPPSYPENTMESIV